MAAVEREELLARVEVLRDMLREREAELGVAVPTYGRGRGRGYGRAQARVVAAGIAVRAAERKLAEHDGKLSRV